jgi:G:T/U-mismatch repair DNA glycosylase
MGYIDNYVVYNHPFEDFLPAGVKTLFIGSLPTHPLNYSKTFPYYYAGEGNMFWDAQCLILNFG